ncbi:MULTISPECIES: aldehyde dehydrogenase family protein [Actinomadura]|uniref:Aldehyde dehydrogenase family protein n=1 Tax=Actinomadura yumaensis TaxID=111807 RepID=A0ABW2CKF7_9ACTN|nr:aldehyde dehydrogenase family protein [Actinomadura sp. J1-007]
MDTLTGIATADAATDEVHRSIATLAGARWELRAQDPMRLDRVVVFLPSNNVLYSYVLFGLIPALYAEQVILRPSTRSMAAAEAVHREMTELLPRGLTRRVALLPTTQVRMVELARDADIVAFTGQYQNGLSIADRIGGRPRMLLFGSGPNPVVVGPAADPAVAAKDVLRARLYNSGQDCLCPDLIFAHASVAERLADEIAAVLADTRVGERADPRTTVAPLVYPDAVETAAGFLREHRARVRHGGAVEAEAGVVEPTVLMFEQDAEVHPPELFSPVFPIVPYGDASVITRWAEDAREVQRGMYLSNYGEPALPHDVVGSAVVCRDATAFDVEDGNRPFGGHGVAASSVHQDGRVWTGPLLLSEQAARLARRPAAEARHASPPRASSAVTAGGPRSSGPPGPVGPPGTAAGSAVGTSGGRGAGGG